MRLYTLKREQFIKRPRPDVYSFFERPENLKRITPPSVGFDILTPQPIRIQTGAVLDYTIRVLAIPVRWTTLITAYHPPQGFSDVALRGPYSFWHHTHTFAEVDGGTLMTDEVRYALPFGLLGRIVHSICVRRQLERIFDFRAVVICRFLGSDGGAGPA